MKTFKEFLIEESSVPESLHFHKGMKDMPKELNGKEFKSWTPPKEHEWNNVEGQDHSINEPPLPKGGKPVVSGLLMHENDGRVWLVKPTKGFGGYNHTFPKGGLEKGLHPQANAIKEAYEESGLKGKITGFAGDREGHARHTRYYHAVREGGHPLDHGWESEGVSLVHPKNFHKYLNTDADKQTANTMINSHKDDE
jgi:ADP-ribose pyrophosphatase YjhB (NUDIX family)